MEKQVLFNYQNEGIQRDVCYSFLESIQTITNTIIVDLESSREYLISGLIPLTIAVFDHLLCDEMRTHTSPFPSWTDSAAGYYRSDSQKMELIRKTLEIEGFDIQNKYTYLGPNSHIEEYSKIYGGKVVKLTPKLSVLILKDCKPEPIIGLSRQEVFAELLLCGINPLEIKNNKPIVYEHRISIHEIISNQGVGSVDQSISKMVSEYRRLFDEEVSIIPIASGTAANEAVIRALKSTGSVASVYIHPFWYYENIPSLERLFQGNITQDVSMANFYFINLEPTNYLNLDYDKKIISPKKLLEEIFSLAQKKRNQLYYVVIDNTVDPFGHINILKNLAELDNVYLITTTSLSKHQNGNRKYFFGIIGLYNKSLKLHKYIEDNSSLVNGLLTDFQKKAFPDLDPHKMQVRISYLRSLNNRIENNFESKYFFSKALSFNTLIFPIESPIKSQSFNYHDYNDSLEYLVKSAIQDFGNPKFEYGDSFGLSQTRIIVQGDDNNFHLPRISPGFNCSFDEVCAFTRYFSKALSKFEYLPNVCK